MSQPHDDALSDERRRQLTDEFFSYMRGNGTLSQSPKRGFTLKTSICNAAGKVVTKDTITKAVTKDRVNKALVGIALVSRLASLAVRRSPRSAVNAAAAALNVVAAFLPDNKQRESAAASEPQAG